MCFDQANHQEENHKNSNKTDGKAQPEHNVLKTNELMKKQQNHKDLLRDDLDSVVQSDNNELSLVRAVSINLLNADDGEQNKQEKFLVELMINEYVSINKDIDAISSLTTKAVKYLHKKRLDERGYRMTNKKLGEGGYGVVYKIYSKNNNQHPLFQQSKPLACKIMILNRKDKCTSLENYSNEIYAMKQCSKHLNIVTMMDNFIYSHGFSTENILLSHSYIIMEYAKLGTLWSKLKKQGPFNENISIYYFKQIVDGLLHLHLQGIAHRDLKLGNILLTNNDKCHDIVKLADFGLSRLVNSKESGLVRFKKPAGTLAYMSPQILACYISTNTNQHLSMHSYDPFKADLWALGVCLYLLLSKQHPFDNPPPNKAERIIFARKMLEKQMKKEWKLPSNMEHTVNSQTQNLLEKLFEPHSFKRINIYDVQKSFQKQNFVENSKQFT